MVKRAAPQRPEDRQLDFDECDKGIERLRRRIAELKDLKPETISEYRSPAIVGLETSIADTLAAIFGQDTPKFRRYYDAADLEVTPNLTIVPGWIGARHGGGGRSALDVHALRHGIAQKRDQAVALLEQAVQSLIEEIELTPSRTFKVPREVAGLRENQAAGELSRNKVFVVHGHDEAAKLAVARFLEQLELKAIILSEQPDQGRTIIEKFEDCAGDVGFAVVLLTPDDLAGKPGETMTTMRARQNVIFELGYFAGKLGRGRACLLRKGNVEIPSDLYGVIYKELDPNNGWKMELVREMKAANLSFDANKIWS